jgi:putative ABC transport system permease protein
MRFIGWLLQASNSVGMLIITRQLERTPGYHFLPSILLVCTISLGIFTASFARTIDRFLYEQNYYRFATDMAVRIVGPPTSLFGGGQANEEPTTYMHISEFNTIPNIESATRLGEYNVTTQFTGGRINGKLIGIDRATFPIVSFWRLDFANQRLGALANALALQPDAVLVTQEFMEARNLGIGDLIRVDVRPVGDVVPLNLQIVGSFEYFPRWYPENDGPLFVGNLDYIFEQAGIELPHVILTRTAPGFDEDEFMAELRSRGAAFAVIQEPTPTIQRVQAQPERQGLFGLLSVGFLASSLVTVLGFFLYTLFSYHRRYVELGILRAVGLSKASMMISVGWELTLLTLVGISLGIGLGLLVSALYIPYLQFGSSPRDLLPPYLVMLAWPEVLQILLLFLMTFAVLLGLLLLVFSRMRIFQAVKLGETV